MQQASPARLYATLVGGVLALTGIIGFFYESSFESGNAVVADEVYGLFAVNGWHNLLHLATGVLGLAAAGYAARTYALGLGLAYTVIAVWGLIAADNGTATLLDVIPVNTEDNLLHLALGLTGMAAGAATPTAPSRPAAEPAEGAREPA